MYVCLCKAVTDKQIRQAAQSGCNTMRCLNNELGVATQCGKCAKDARQILRDFRQEQAALNFDLAVPAL
ncbi:bacterioferritin-associated ferredoxin [Kangiella sp. TOML190]|uniref:bacterioferritin-associated ferredoxin n=1 Tax=Kangiella sp. TOML190 TaxID=2931351 RepID=UPI0035DF9B3E